MITELSEIKRKFSVEMIECSPKEEFTSMLTTIRLCNVSYDCTTFISWEALFSNDVSTDVLKCKKERARCFFKDLKNYFEKK